MQTNVLEYLENIIERVPNKLHMQMINQKLLLWRYIPVQGQSVAFI